MAEHRVIKFDSDTKHRKQWFTGISFSHPAKMSLPLQLWLIENFTKEGETILDPMAGSGTLLVACSMGRNVICVELEQKFVDMMKGNWEKIQQRGSQLGYTMGTATILQGDARNLAGILADKIVTSPPYSESPVGGGLNTKPPREGHDDQSGRSSSTPSQLGAGKYDKIITSPPYQAQKVGGKQGAGSYSGTDLSQGINRVKNDYAKNEHPNNIGNLPYGQADKIITSPPYASGGTKADENPENYIRREEERLKLFPTRPKTFVGRYSGDRDNIGNLPYGQIDAVISSPPYEGSLKHPVEDREKEFEKLRALGYKINPNSADNKTMGDRYSGSASNIGNLKSDSYLSAMLQVYQQCFAVLKHGGLLILVTKNFIRNKKQVRLDLDTIKICEQAGFTYQDRWYRELASQSFWRTIYHQRYPSVPPIKYEDILVFGK